MEVIVYTALLIVVISYVVFFAINIFNAESKSRARREVVLATERGLRSITEEIRRAHGVYEPTSVFDDANGQLSLVSISNIIPADEAYGYVDFFLSDGVIYRKIEGQSAEAMTSPNVSVTELTFEHINQGTPEIFPESVRVRVEAENRTANLELQSSFEAESAASPRGYFALPEIQL